MGVTPTTAARSDTRVIGSDAEAIKVATDLAAFLAPARRNGIATPTPATPSSRRSAGQACSGSPSPARSAVLAPPLRR